ncbi:hypothetical protein ACRQ1B_28855 [Rhizobium panacihumi]|uniref:hypothetical protein n=1 Tax=Rhizobium panacihumi TaxID=2008450 RepID=UPI003D7B0AC4
MLTPLVLSGGAALVVEVVADRDQTLMDGFDALPQLVREAIAFADFPFPLDAVGRMLRRGVPADIVADVILSVDRRISRLRGER